MTTSVIIRQQPNAGTDGSTSICDSNTTPINLFSLITGEQTGGIWTRSSGIGGTLNAGTGVFTPVAGMSSSSFTYTLTGVSPCANDTSTVTLTVLPQTNAGTDGVLSVCDSNTSPIDLFGLIAGEQAGGVWIRNSGTGGTFNAVAGTYSPAPGATSSDFIYTVSGTAPCLPDTSTVAVTIVPVVTPTLNCGTSTTTSVQFNWAAVSGATGYTVSYQINANPVVNVGAIGNLQTYLVGSLNPGDNVTITVTPTGALGSCFNPATQLCTAANCVPPTANIVYGAASFCTSLTAAQTVTLTGSGAFNTGTFSAPAGLAINTTTGDISPASSTAGNYTVTYTIASTGGCPAVTATTPITIAALPAIPTLTATQPTCTVATGTVTITGLPGLTYSFDGGAYSATLVYSGLTAGSSHTVTAQNAAGCISPIANITLNAQPATPAIPTLTATQPTCTVATGTVTITALPGLTYSFDGGAYNSTLIYSGLTAGSSHTVTAQNAAGCISTVANITLNAQPATPAIPALTATQPTCAVATGTVTITGLPGLTYSFDGGAYSATLVYSGLTAGSSHTVTAQNAAGCISPVASITLNAQPATPAIPTLTATQPTCTIATGTVTITGLPGLTYSFDGGAYNSTLIYSGLTAGSSHTVTAQNAAGCISPVANITLNAQPAIPAIPALTATQPTCTVATGTITITGLPGLTYSFDGGAYSATLVYSGLTAGSSHTVTAQNAAGCISPVASITLNAQPATPAIPTLTATQPTCTIATGTVTITGLPGLTYSFDGGAYNSTLIYSGLTAGSSHTVTAQNAAGCISPVANITLNAQPATPAIPALTATQSTCTIATGTVTITGLPGLTYSFDGGAYNSTLIYSGLTAGTTHTVTAQNAAGCISTAANITLNAQPATPAIPALTATQPTCTVATGTVTITGLPGLTYSFDGGAYSATLVYSGLTAGSAHTVTAQNAAGCISTVASITLNAQPATPAIPTLTATQPTCNVATGTVTITGLPGLTYSFDGGAYSATLVYSGLTAGSAHTVTAQNAAGCVSTVANITLSIPLNIPATPVCVVTQPTCSTASGTITINGVPGEDYSFDSAPYSSVLVYAGLAAGSSHTVTARNAAGCISSVANITLNAQPLTPAIPALTATQPNCSVATGSVSITGIAGLTYSFDGGSYSSALVYSGLAAGSSHTVMAQNVAGCISAVANITLATQPTTPTTPILTPTQPSCTVATGTVTITGIPGLTYSFDGGAYTPTLTYSGLAAGSSHTVTAQNAAGCISPLVSLTLGNLPLALAAPTAVVTQPTCTVATGTISIAGIPGLVYSFDGAAYSPTLTYTGLIAGSSHNITAQDAAGCISAATNVTLNAQPVTSAMPTFSMLQPTCSTATGTVTINAVAGLTYSLDGGTYSLTLIYSGLAAGSSHTLSAQNAAGCISAVANFTVNAQPITPAIPILTRTHPDCTIATGTITIAGIAGLTYSLDGSPYSSNLFYSGVVAGTHTVTAQNAAGCISAPATVILFAQPATPAPPILIASQPTCTSPTGQIIIGGNTSGMLYSLDGGPYNNLIVLNNIAPGIHTVSGINIPGCISAISTITIDAPPPIPAIPVVTLTQPTCTTATGTLNITGTAGVTYSLDGNAYSSNLVYSGLAAGSSHTVTAKNSAGCNSTTTSFTFNAQPITPVATALPTVQTICSGSTTSIALTSIAGTAFSWTVAQTGVAGAAAGSGNSIAQILNTTGNVSGQAVYTVVPLANGCTGLPISVTVIVNPLPVAIANPTLQTICSGQRANINLSSLSDSGVTFNWTVVQTGVSGAVSGSGNTISQILTATGTSAGTVDYTIVPVRNGCLGTPIHALVTVNPRPQVTTNPVFEICDGDTANINLTANVAGTGYTWTVAQSDVDGALGGTGSIINQPLTLTGNTAGTVTYTIRPSSLGCDGDLYVITVKVNPLPKPTLLSGNICVSQASGTTVRSYVLDSGLNNATHHFEWTHDGVVIPGATLSTYEATLAGNYSVIATNIQTNCVSAEVFATVTAIYTASAMTAVGTDAFSENASIVVSVKGGTGPFFYQLANGPLQSSNVFSGLGGGTYTVKVIDEYGCTDLETEVTLIDYPKFFTPNGDGYNDYWNIFSLSGQPAEISIFDRYGKLVKQISTRGEGWDGIYNGHLLPSTDYWFTVDYTENKIPKVFRAHFSLKR